MKLKLETTLEKTLAGVCAVLLLVTSWGTRHVVRQSDAIDDLQDEQVKLRTYATSAAVKVQDVNLFVPNQLIVSFKPSTSPAQRQSLLDGIGATDVQTLRTAESGSMLEAGPESGEVSLATLKAPKPITDPKILTAIASTQPASDSKVTVADRVSLGDAIARLAKSSQVEFVQPNYIYSLADVPNDDLYAKGLLWNMYSSQGTSGQSLLSNEYGIQAPTVWARGVTGSNKIYVAVIDSGIDATHPDLAANVDVADATDLVRNSSQPGDVPFVNKDEIGHGSHVAGIIGAIGNNNIGVDGVAWSVKLVPIKVVKAGANQSIDEGTAIKAFEAVARLKRSGINIVAVNASWGSYGIFDNKGNLIPDRALLAAVKDAARLGILCVTAAGNNGNDNDKRPFYPANFDTTDSGDGSPGLPFDAVISVAALNPDGSLWSLSNYGAKSVRLGAPGAAIVSTIPANSQYARSGLQTFRSSDGSLYAAETGTSAAAPHISGAIALYYSEHPSATPSEALDAISRAVTSTRSLTGRTSTGSRLTLSQSF
jgi:subtilisin family serine protease